MKKGLLITLEGNEGCGKSTQIRLLYAYLKKRGLKVYLTREPGGTKISDDIRQILLDRKNNKMSALTETFLYMASRAQLVEEVIAPKLKKGWVVLCDRWLDATVAYQGFGGGIDKEWIRGLGQRATQNIHPDISLFLDLPLEIGLKRAVSHKKADRLEKKSLAFHRRVRAGYGWIAQKEPKRFRRVPLMASDSVQIVHEKIKKALRRVLG